MSEIPRTVDEVIQLFRNGACTPARAETAIRLAANITVIQMNEKIITQAQEQLAAMRSSKPQ